MRKLTIAFAASAALLAGPALAGPVRGNAPVTVNPLTEAQVTIELGPNHERWRSRRARERERDRCKTVTIHRSETSRSKTVRECRD